MIGTHALELRAAVIVFSYYPEDPRVRREAEALAGTGMPIDVICLRNVGEKRFSKEGHVSVFRLPVLKRREGMLRYVWQYTAFFVLAMLLLTWLHISRRYRVIHVHNMPDVLVFTALIPKLTGSRVILDLHDPMPEVFMTKYSLQIDRAPIRTLVRAERASIAFADLVLTPNVAFRELFLARGCPSSKIQIVMNSPDERVFRVARGAPVTRHGDGDPPFSLMYHGTIVKRHGLDVALEAIASVRDSVKDVRLQVYGEGEFTTEFRLQIERLGLGDVVRYHGHVTLEAIASIIPTIDVGLIPNSRSVFTEINLPTRIFEYLAMGKPVIAPRTKGILDYFDESSLFLFEPGDYSSLARAILSAHADPSRRASVLTRGIEVYEEHTWRHESDRFVGMVNNLARSSNIPVRKSTRRRVH